jgi:Fe-Mn family superoxide dismutase
MKFMSMTRKSMIQTLSLSAAGFILTRPLQAISGSLYGNEPFAQTPLLYNYNALEPIIDGRTMEIHYSKHAAGYCNNLNNAVLQSQIDIAPGLEHILSNVSKYPATIRNHGGGHYNHELFWKCMKPEGSILQEGKFKKDMHQIFGSIENVQKIFSDVALSRFGSGWAWLLVTPEGKLAIDSTPNQDNPLMDISSVRGYPLLGLDVWEHAYYLKYQNRRAEYIKQWWGIVDWDFVSRRYLDLSGSP